MVTSVDATENRIQITVNLIMGGLLQEGHCKKMMKVEEDEDVFLSFIQSVTDHEGRPLPHRPNMVSPFPDPLLLKSRNTHAFI